MDPCPVRGWCLSSLHGAMVSTFLLLPLLLLWLQGPFSGERVGGRRGGGQGPTCSWTPSLLFLAHCAHGTGGGEGRADLAAPHQGHVRRIRPSIWPQARLTLASQTKIKLWTLPAGGPPGVGVGVGGLICPNSSGPLPGPLPFRHTSGLCKGKPCLVFMGIMTPDACALNLLFLECRCRNAPTPTPPPSLPPCPGVGVGKQSLKPSFPPNIYRMLLEGASPNPASLAAMATKLPLPVQFRAPPVRGVEGGHTRTQRPRDPFQGHPSRAPPQESPPPLGQSSRVPPGVP